MKKIIISLFTISYVIIFGVLSIFYVPFVEYANLSKNRVERIIYAPLWYSNEEYEKIARTCSEISVIRLLIEIIVLTVVFAGLIYISNIIIKNNKKI